MFPFRFLIAGAALAACAAATAGAPPSAASASRERIAERLHAQAVGSFRQGRFPEAYGRFMALADAGHAPAAEVVRWMYENGPSLFGRDWDCSPDQLLAWARLAPPGSAARLSRTAFGAGP